MYAVRYKNTRVSGDFMYLESREVVWDPSRPWSYDPDVWEWAGPLEPTQMIIPC